LVYPRTIKSWQKELKLTTIQIQKTALLIEIANSSIQNFKFFDPNYFEANLLSLTCLFIASAIK